MPHRGFVSNEKFVKSWRRATHIDDMVSYTGLGKDYIYVRAQRLRALGVVLEPWPKRSIKDKLDVEALNKLTGWEGVKRG